MRNSIWFILVSFLLLGCDSVGPGNTDRLSFQVPGCMAKSSDTCFNYTFYDELITDFCVEGNCCPDSARFTFRHDIKADTINLYVNDIEERLCRCICTYSLHTSFSELPLDSYLLNVFYSYRESEIVKLYSMRVNRSN